MVELAPKDKTVLMAFNESGLSLRSVTGLSKDTGLAKTEVQATLSRLIAQSLVDQIVSDKGVRFYLTREGRVATVNA